MVKAATIKTTSDIEFMVIGNAFGLLIASSGLLGGVMVSQRSFDFWLDDILPIALVLWMFHRLYRSFLATMATYPDIPSQVSSKGSVASSVTPEPVIAGQITSTPTPPSPEQVVEEVARRIEAKKKATEKKNKSAN